MGGASGFEHVSGRSLLIDRFVTYGDIAMEQHLEMIDRCALSRFSHCDSDTSVPSEPQWTSAVS